MKEYVYLDFEYNNTKEEKLNIVCGSFLVKGIKSNFWLNGRDPSEIKEFILKHKDYIFVSFNVEAEARCFNSLGLKPTKFKWLDLFLEYRHLTNHNHKIQYGKQLLNGKVKTTKPPKNKWSSSEEGLKEDNNSKPSHSLSAACFKLLNVKIDTDRKNRVRDVIINDSGIEKYKKEILEYCDSDVVYLPELAKAIFKEYRLLPRKITLEECINRAEYSARTAIMVSIGYPVDIEAVKNFSNSVFGIIWSVQKEINDLFPDIKPFRRNSNYSYTWDQKATRNWIIKKGFKNWMKTDSGNVSLCLEAFTRFLPFTHKYPKDSFGAQMVRFLKLKQGLNGFSPKSKNKFVDYLGSDGRVRPYFNIYGSQSSRSQPKATGFLFLKSAWMRSLCVPKKGRIIGAIDYKSEEFILAGIAANDSVMIDAYLSGDPYLFFAKEAGAVPPSGTKKSHKKERDLFKATTLGLSYDMSKYGLAKKLTLDLGYPVSEEEAEKLITKFYRLYREYKHYKKDTQRNYYIKDKYISLPDGWCLWGDNDNSRSVGNFPIQGLGAVIMRKAVALAQDSGIDIILTLHDALYAEFDLCSYKEGMKILGKCMQEAFKFYLPTIHRSVNIGLDANVWGKDLSDGEYYCDYLGNVKMQSIYIDERSVSEYNQFKKYFEKEEFNL